MLAGAGFLISERVLDVTPSLALLGIEAKIETAAIADKGTMHRVRAGPFATVEQVNKTREALRQNGIETQLIRIRETPETR